MTENQLPEAVKDRYEKARMALDRKNYGYAVELLTQIISIKPDFDKARQLLRAAEIKNFEASPPNIVVGTINRVISFLHAFAGMASESKANYHKAMSIYENILRRDPKNVAVLLRLGRILRAHDMKESAAAALENAVTVATKDIYGYQLLGEIYCELGKYEQASSCFERILKLKPHNAKAERGLKNIAALHTIDKSFDRKDTKDLRIREIEE